MGMFSPAYNFYNDPTRQYQLIGGAYYQPGSAAAKKAAQLAASAPRPVTPTSAAASILAPYAPKATAPTSFPSYPNMGGSMSAGGGASLPGSPGMPGQGAFGLVPRVPNPVATAGGAITGNLGNLGALGQLGTGTTSLAANLAQMPFQANLPGYGGMLQQSSQNIAANQAGVINPQQWSELQRKLAERGTSTGLAPNSPANNTALMIALNQSIAGTQALGEQQFNQAIARTPTGQPFNIAGQQISPADLQAAQYASNLYAAAPDPTMAAQANLDMLLRSIEAGRAGGMGGMGGLGGGGGGVPRIINLGGGPLSPVSGAFGGYYRPQPTTPGWSGKVTQPFYRTAPTAPGSMTDMQWNEPYAYDVQGPEDLIPSDAFNPYTLGGYSFGNENYDPNFGVYNPMNEDYQDYSNFGVYNPFE